MAIFPFRSANLFLLTIMFLSRRVYTFVPKFAFSISGRFASSTSSPLSEAVQYLNVPFEEKDEVKALGGRYDSEKKKWYVPTGRDTTSFRKWMTFYLNVPYQDKDTAKSLGAMWDKEAKKWSIRGGQDFTPFQKWMEAKEEAKEEVKEEMKEELKIPPVPEVKQKKTTRKTKAKKEEVIPVAIVDIDTTGLPLKVNGTYDKFTALASYNPSRIIQLSYIITDLKTWEPIEKRNYIIKADGFPIDAVEFHGITPKKSQLEGIPFTTAARELMTAIRGSKFLIFHNAEFCLNILKSELYRYGLFMELESLPQIKPICIMERSRSVMGLLDVTKKPKVPSMKELIKIELNEDLPQIHTSAMDAEYIRLIIQKWTESNKFKLEDLLEN